MHRRRATSAAPPTATQGPSRGTLAARIAAGVLLMAFGAVELLVSFVLGAGEVARFFSGHGFMSWGPSGSLVHDSWRTTGGAAVLFLSMIVGGLALAIHSAYRLGRARTPG